jgi:acyl-CoA thioesterase-1
VRVVNASVSGDTTSGGRSRLPPLLAQHRPSVVVIELGGNDALRGLPLAMTEDNLSAMTRAARDAGARVVLAGMQVPPNYGRKYGEDFFALFARVARAERASLVPFLLKGVADDPARAEQLFQPDRIHPTAAAHPIMLDNVWPVLRPLLK